jgi:hypothetical protein
MSARCGAYIRAHSAKGTKMDEPGGCESGVLRVQEGRREDGSADNRHVFDASRKRLVCSVTRPTRGTPVLESFRSRARATNND